MLLGTILRLDSTIQLECFQLVATHCYALGSPDAPLSRRRPRVQVPSTPLKLISFFAFARSWSHPYRLRTAVSRKTGCTRFASNPLEETSVASIKTRGPKNARRYYVAFDVGHIDGPAMPQRRPNFSQVIIEAAPRCNCQLAHHRSPFRTLLTPASMRSHAAFMRARIFSPITVSL